MLTFEDEPVQAGMPLLGGVGVGVLVGGAQMLATAKVRLQAVSGMARTKSDEGGESGEHSKPVASANADANRRVSVEDKRIINCKADVNQLVPFKYLRLPHSRRSQATGGHEQMTPKPSTGTPHRRP